MSTYKLLLRLSNMARKTDYLNYIDYELGNTIQALQNAGYQINKNTGLTGRHSFKTANDIVLFSYYRELHFIYYGLTNNQWVYDPVDKLYLIGLQGFVSAQYNSLV